jgi:RNA polymerase sigma-70 factor (ECF subfamily)
MASNPASRALGNQLASAPDPRVVTELQAKRGQALFGLALRLGLSPEDSSEAVQETLLRLWTELSAGRSIDAPEAWAFRVLYRIAMDEHRHRARSAGLGHELKAAAPQTHDAEAVLEGMAVWAEVDRLPERQRLALYLRYRADLSFEDVAGVLGISASGARSQATTGIATLRRRLAGRGDTP